MTAPADRWAVTLASLLGEPLPPLPTVPPERCRQHKAPPNPGTDDYARRFDQALMVGALGFAQKRGWRP